MFSKSRRFYLAIALSFIFVWSSRSSGDELFIEPLFAPVLTASDQVYRSDALRIDGSATTIRFDIYRPAQIAGGPAVPELLPGMVLIHGGGFSGGSKNSPNIVSFANYFASRGYVVSSIDYRLMNDNPLLDPAVESGPIPVFPPADPQEYVLWANNPDNASERQASAANAAHNDASRFSNLFFSGGVVPDVDSTRITVMGPSAGGITSMLVGYSDHPNGPSDDFGAVVSLAGALFGAGDVIDTDDPPLWFQHGTNDQVVDFAFAIEILLQVEVSGIPSIFRTHDLGHASSAAYFNRLTPAGLTFAEDSVRFLYQQMNMFELAEIELGDLNQDGVVNLLDIAPFVELLSIGGYRKEADISQDGVLNLLDVDPFVTLLSGQ